MDLRCDHGILHGVIPEEGVVEFRCRSARCGHEPGVVVIHKFNTHTGELIQTNIYAEPKRKETTSASSRIRTALRSA